MTSPAQVEVRQVPAWRTRKLRPVVLALTGIVLVWLALAAMVHLAERSATPLAGRVVSSEPFTRKGDRLYHVDFVYTDEDGQTHQSTRSLVAGLARRLGLTTVDAPVTVKRVLGLPQIEGAPDVLIILPFIFAGTFGLLAILVFWLDSVEARKIDLALHGVLARGRLDSLTTRSYKSSITLTLSYHFDTASGPQTGKEKIATTRSVGLLMALALDRVPQEGDEVRVAHAAEAPHKSVIYSFGEDDAYPAVATRLAPLPSGLTCDTPRALPSGAPAVRPALLLVLLVPVGAILLTRTLVADPEVALPVIFGITALTVSLLVLTLPSSVLSLLQQRRLLRTGEPVAARVLHTTWLQNGKQQSIAFEAHTSRGRLRGKERLHRRRLARMGASPEVGDTMFLVVEADRPWERVVWGFAGRG